VSLVLAVPPLSPPGPVPPDRPDDDHDAQHHEGHDEDAEHDGEGRGQHALTLRRNLAGPPGRPLWRGRFVTWREHTPLMTAATIAPSDDLVVALRGATSLRPSVDHGLAGGLRGWLNDGIFELAGVPAPGQLRVATRDVLGVPPSGERAGLLRGTLVAQLLRLHVAGCTQEDPFGAASAALAASGRDDDLAALLAELDADDRARLAAEVASHAAVLVERLPAIPARWSPRVGVSHRVPLAGGGAVLSGRVDLTLGAPGGATACVCLLDVTTSPLESRHLGALNYLALLTTLRAGEAPLRVAALSTADGAAVVRDVDTTMLTSAVAGVLRAIAAMVAR
jgi:hypothetical protein